jgi:hypothetical protein
MRATSHLITSRHVWKGLSSNVTAWTRPCLHCQWDKVNCNIQVLLQHIPTAKGHFNHIHVDQVGPLPPSKGFTHWFTIMDRTSRQPEAIPIANTPAQAAFGSPLILPGQFFDTPELPSEQFLEQFSRTLSADEHPLFPQTKQSCCLEAAAVAPGRPGLHADGVRPGGRT